MWFHLGCKNFIAKKNKNDEFCDIFVSDLVRIWHKSLSNEELLLISQKLNPLFEAPVQKLRDLTLSLLSDVNAEKNIKEENNKIVLKLQSNIMNVKFQFHAVLSQGDEEMFYREFTTPLLLMLIKIQDREMKLIEIIKHKDAEIKDYKQGYGISSNYLSTKPFSKKEFYCQEKASDVLWDNSFLDYISSKLLTVETGCGINKEVLPMEVKSDRLNSIDISDKKNSILKSKNCNQSTDAKQCILLDNKVIKKIKKPYDGPKIKF